MKRRRAILVFIVGTFLLAVSGAIVPEIIERSQSYLPSFITSSKNSAGSGVEPGGALEALEKLDVKGRAPKTGYTRDQFGNGWSKILGCDTRNIILYRDLISTQLQNECIVVAGELNDPYTGKLITFSKADSAAIQIDHVVALSDAWQKGAQQLTSEQRKQLANDPLELLAADGPANQAKGDGDAATWLPSNKAFRCQYIARQVAVKLKYSLWVTSAEKLAMAGVLATCPDESLP